MKTLKLDFADFYGIQKNNNFFTNLLSPYFDIELNCRPDLLIFSNSGHINRLHSCKKIYVTGESLAPNWKHTDYAMTSHHLDDSRHIRLPYYVWGTPGTWQDLIKNQDQITKLIKTRQQFCSAVITNANLKRTATRINFFKKLNAIETIASGGSFMNNYGDIGSGPINKINFIKNYKFNLCYENTRQTGYITEKLTDAMLAKTIPIYWGCDRVGEEFNKKSFLLRNDYSSDEEFIEKIIEVHRNPKIYEEMLREPYFINNQPNIYYDLNRIVNFIQDVVDSNKKPISRNKNFSFFGRWRLAKKNPNKK
jgi:hypothetical protein